MTIWEYNPPPAKIVGAFRKQLHLKQVVAELLARLGYVDLEVAREFLRPNLKTIESPFEIPNLEAAARRICRAIDDRQRIVICGDYDVDGVTSTALLVDILKKFDTYPNFIVPLRLEEGYGLTQKAAERAMDCGESADLFIALDCGTNSVEEADYILSRGCDLIIVDHHQSSCRLPDKALLVNPHVASDRRNETLKLCTVGLVFKLAHGLLKLRRQGGDERAFSIRLREYLDFVAMGTLADLVPLTGENRIFTRIGLEALAKTQRIGLRSLMDVAGMTASHGVRPVDIAFKLGPRINASGRLADASIAVELLLSEDRHYCLETALSLDSFNRERQEIEKRIADDAMNQVRATQASSSGLVVYGSDWHPGVVGIVASRVAREFNRPTIVLGNEGALAKGSGRSVDGVNLVEVLTELSDQLENWGGHPMAVGISMQKDRLEAFRESFDQAVKSFIETRPYDRTLEISTYLSIDDIGPDLMSEIALLEPFGQENPEPLFAIKGIAFRQRPKVFKDAHFRFALTNSEGRLIHGVAWKMADRIPELNTPIDIAFRLVWNSFGRQKILQIDLVDWKHSD